MDIKTLYETTELTQVQIAAQLGVPWKRVFKYIKANYPAAERKARKAVRYRNSKLGELNPMSGKVGDTHPNFIGTVSDSKGYWMVLKPDWYTGRKRSKHVFEHHVVVCEALGLTEIPPGYHVHHCDCNPRNNAFDNLVLLEAGEHASLHRVLAGATTISKESTLKWVEARRAGNRYDIV